MTFKRKYVELYIINKKNKEAEKICILHILIIDNVDNSDEQIKNNIETTMVNTMMVENKQKKTEFNIISEKPCRCYLFFYQEKKAGIGTISHFFHDRAD
jgi:hypothetical protein